MGRNLKNLAKDTSGTVFIYTAASLAVLLGMAGLAVDLGYWYWSQRDMQSAADSAAMSAALEMARGATGPEIEARARDSATLNGYQHGLAALVTVNRPPASGVHAGDANYIEAIVQQDQSGFVSSMVHSGDMTVAARAVATLAGAPSCVIALNPSDDQVLSIEGKSDVQLGCGAQSNSTSATAVSQQGKNSSLTAESVSSAGGYEGSNYTPMPQTGMPTVEDPFAYLDPPTVGPCDEPAGAPYTIVSGMGSVTLDPGVYCGGIDINGGDITFNPGLYIVDEVGLQIKGASTVDGDGVTFYIPPTATGVLSATYDPLFATLYIAGQAQVTLTAPNNLADPYDGILFYQDPASPANLVWDLAGGSDMILGGVLYAPTNDIYFAGGSSTSGNPWTAIIADEVHFVGNSSLGSGVFGAGNRLPMAMTLPSLAE
jgi:Flp pilus assembly protein TadG